MGHTPYGYMVADGKAVINEAEAEKVRQIFENYISGMSLSESAKSAGYPLTHSMVKRLLQKKCYIGDGFYPPIISQEMFEQAGAIIRERTVKRNPIRKEPVVHTDFVMKPLSIQCENHIEQAEYMYSLIEVK